MDLLVRLYDLPGVAPRLEALAAQGVTVRRALASERHAVVAFARQHGSPGWASEVEVAFARVPLGVFVATEGEARVPGAPRPVGYPQQPETLIGFSCVEATARGFFGPQCVRIDRRGRGVGAALLLAALHAMRDVGYAYAIVGWASELDFYKRVCGAVPIDGSEPGIYRPQIVE
ncbi:MAG TPA: GNAT family N-acetyltransferase [Polyangia bacterium]|nr:GNAT family N-acetyltransferase [Polyangia bacterium]